MVPVVVDQQNLPIGALTAPGHLEPATDALEAAQRPLYRRRLDAELAGHRDGREGVSTL